MTASHLATPCAAALILLAAATATPAAAASTSMPGRACQAASDSSPSLLFHSGSEIKNGDDSFVGISCPVEKHLSRIVSAEVMLIDRNPSADISCTLLTFNRDGSTRSNATRQSSGSFSVALPIIFPGQLAPTGAGSYGLACVLPGFSAAASSIVGYSVIEQ